MNEKSKVCSRIHTISSKLLVIQSVYDFEDDEVADFFDSIFDDVQAVIDFVYDME